jgi:hypothetical protein
MVMDAVPDFCTNGLFVIFVQCLVFLGFAWHDSDGIWPTHPIGVYSMWKSSADAVITSANW